TSTRALVAEDSMGTPFVLRTRADCRKAAGRRPRSHRDVRLRAARRAAARLPAAAVARALRPLGALAPRGARAPAGGGGDRRGARGGLDHAELRDVARAGAVRLDRVAGDDPDADLAEARVQD